MSILFMVDFAFFKTKYFRGFLPIPNYTVLLLMIVKMAIESVQPTLAIDCLLLPTTIP